jgi:hypothetical protein
MLVANRRLPIRIKRVASPRRDVSLRR